jgi:alkylated DNA repair dioxygenase AlkB
VLQTCLLDAPEGTSPPALDHDVEQIELSHGAWVEYRQRWLPDWSLFDLLLAKTPWHAERRPMYDRVVDVPRLLAFYDSLDGALPHRMLAEARDVLDARYRLVLGEGLQTLGLCCYRDGRDSVAWHGDTIGRAARQDTVVAILSLGAPRRFALRPLGGGPGLRFDLHHGDLLVMGGSCQRTWQHAVPKTSRPAGPRISAQFRARGVR